jgi:hypothetical protein
MMDIPKEHMEDPKYGYVIDGMFLLSKWLRENEPQEPKYKVGDLVELTIEGEITKVYKDCDGTPLYEVNGNIRGYSESSITALAPSPTELLAMPKEQREEIMRHQFDLAADEDLYADGNEDE